MLNKTHKLFSRSFNTNNLFDKIFKSRSFTDFSFCLIKNHSRAFSSIMRKQKLLQSPEELYSSPIYDKSNPEFSEIYLDFIFNLNSSELNQTKINYSKITDNIVNLIKLYSSIEDQDMYVEKLDYILDHLYANSHKFSCYELIKIFQTLIDKNIGEMNLLVKMNFFISNKINLAKRNALHDKVKFEEFIHIFFNHFHTCAESGFSNTEIFNAFINTLAKDNFLKDLLSNEANINNVIYLIALSIANLHEIKNNSLLEKTFLEPHKEAVNVNCMVSILKLLNLTSQNLENGNKFERSNSRNRLFKALTYLKAEGVQLSEKLEEFLTKYNCNDIAKFEKDVFEIENKYEGILANILQKIGIKFEQNKKFDICEVDFFIEPGVCIRINQENRYQNDNLKGTENFVNRYLYLKNYDVINLPYYLFEEESKLEETIKKRFYHFINQGYDRITDSNKF